MVELRLEGSNGTGSGDASTKARNWERFSAFPSRVKQGNVVPKR